MSGSKGMTMFAYFFVNISCISIEIYKLLELLCIIIISGDYKFLELER
jgi:hypothetical protein